MGNIPKEIELVIKEVVDAFGVSTKNVGKLRAFAASFIDGLEITPGVVHDLREQLVRKYEEICADPRFLRNAEFEQLNSNSNKLSGKRRGRVGRGMRD